MNRNHLFEIIMSPVYDFADHRVIAGSICKVLLARGLDNNSSFNNNYYQCDIRIIKKNIAFANNYDLIKLE